MIAEQLTCEEHFLIHTTQQSDGRFVDRLPFKLERDPDLKIKYHKFTKEYEELGHREPVNSQMGKKTCYCPTHTVFKETSFTKKR
jgi:hypothetical protein